MSRIFKRPKPLLNMGNPHARLIKYARTIRTEEELKQIISHVDRETALGFLETVREYLPFKLELSIMDNPPLTAE